MGVTNIKSVQIQSTYAISICLIRFIFTFKMEGTIKKLVSDKNFGFIAVEGGDDVFFHANNLDESLDFNSLNEGDKVSFEVEETPKGKAAINVNKVEAAE